MSSATAVFIGFVFPSAFSLNLMMMTMRMMMIVVLTAGRGVYESSSAEMALFDR